MLSLFKKKDQSPTADGQSGVLGAVAKLFDKNEKEVAKLWPVVKEIAALGPELKKLSDEELKERSQQLRQKFQEKVTQRLKNARDPQSGEAYDWQELATEFNWSEDYKKTRREVEKEILDELLVEAFALVREASDRTIGLRHFDVQMIGGAVLHSGRIAEMKTGEGKTLVATTPVYLNALAGRGVHVITVNDYLAERDANWMRPIFEFLGLTVAALSNDMDPEARKAAYNSDVLYATNSEVGFDYLRDNMARAPEDVVQRPPYFAIVDEVDNILIDEARTPLIISAQVAKTDRAIRRQQMAKTCDGLARRLMPAVTDRDVENLIDSLTEKGRIDIDALMDNILARGPFRQATEYLIDAYLTAEKSARLENAARLLDVAGEFHENGLIDDAGRQNLESIAVAAVNPQKLEAAWQEEVARLLTPAARAYSHAASRDFETGRMIIALTEELTLSSEAQTELIDALEEADDKAHTVANFIAEELMARGLIEESGLDIVADALAAVAPPDMEAPTAHPGEDEETVRSRHAEKVAAAMNDDVLAALITTTLSGDSALHDADAVLQEALAGAQAATPATTHTLVEALEDIAARGLLPFESLEKLWETVRLTQGRDALRKEIENAVTTYPGTATQKINELISEYSARRQTWLQEQADKLREELPGHSAIADKARSGESVSQLRRLLQTGLTKNNSAFNNAMKAAKNFVADQNSAHSDLAARLVDDLDQWVEVPRDLKKTLANLLNEGGPTDAVRERLLLAVRDLPGENSELPAIVTDAARQEQNWRGERGEQLLDEIAEHIELSTETQNEIRAAVDNGEYSAGFDNFIGEQLLTSPEIAPLSQAVENWGEAWQAFEDEQSTQLLENIEGVLPLSVDAQEALDELLAKADEGDLKKRIATELAGDAVSRHLEPLLTEENAPVFTDELKRRIPLAKDTQKKLSPAEFEGRSSEQLQRAIVRLTERSLLATPFDDYKRVVKNLGWAAEKDEKRRNSALTDMGTLIAEREAGRPIFTDPDNLLDTLISSEVITEDEAAILERAQNEHPHESLSSLIDRVLRLPAERRRRFAEIKLQEVQSILDQSIKAHALFEREVKYVVEDGREIVIVDEFTGRKMPGRRFSEGLHEALEAKHGLEVQLESQTVATITIQNYFRLYQKLAGMTGTAKTEEQEFAKTYGMEVISIPTNRSIARADHPDVIYKTAEAKFRAITFEILERYCASQPVLVGTRSVEVSERMAERLKAQPLQSLALSHLIKIKLWDDKEMPDEKKQQIFTLLRIPIGVLSPEQVQKLREMGLPPEPLKLPQVKQLAREAGINPDALADENIDKLLGQFTAANPDREKLEMALRVGLPHNVLNAKNHRNEARIVAEAARPGSVTIATNMAGRGVDIVLGGTLDVESRWRVITLQALARTLEGKTVHVRSRNQETTEKLLSRLQPEALQDLAWVTAISEKVDALEDSHKLEGQAAKELRDALGQELTAADLKTRVRSRAKRANLLDELPLDAEPLSDDALLKALNRRLERLLGSTYELDKLRDVLQQGIIAQTAGRDFGETLLLQTISGPLEHVQNATSRLLETLSTLKNLDSKLLQAAADSGAHSKADFNAENLAEQIGHVTPGWVMARLSEMSIHDAASASHRLSQLKDDEFEVNEAQILAPLEDAGLSAQWLRERLRGWNLVKGERAYDAPPEMQQLLRDNAVVHYHLDVAAAKQMAQQWREDAVYRREHTLIEAPNLMLLNDMSQLIGGHAPFLDPEWLHLQLQAMEIITGPEDVFQAQMTGTAQDEQGNQHQVPVDVLVYHLRLDRVLKSLAPTIREAIAAVGEDQKDVLEYVNSHALWAKPFIDEQFVAQLLETAKTETRTIEPGQASVFVETGVAGQDTDIVLESEPRPEDIAHTSEQQEVKELGGLHIIGTERHESRRIDNQLRGRAGRQGDPGSSRFYVSLDDELWRLFGTRGQWLMSKWDEDEPVEAGMISKSIERAQKKVELNHFESRKQVLQYDDVMNMQREVIYRERRRALLGEDMRDTALDMAHRAALAEAAKHCPRGLRSEEWDTHRFYLGLGRIFGTTLVAGQLSETDLDDMEWEERGENVYEVILHDGRALHEIVEAMYNEREEQVDAEWLRGFERWQLMRSIDEYWMEHLAEMDYLRDAIWQEGYAQKEPIGVYRQEGFALFQKMLENIRREVAEAVFSVAPPQQAQASAQLVSEYSGPQMQAMQEARVTAALPMDEDGMDDGVHLNKDADGDDGDGVLVGAGTIPPTQSTRQPITQALGGRTNGAVVTTATQSTPAASSGHKVGRNDPCPCGSGKKYKKCCLPKEG